MGVMRHERADDVALITSAPDSRAVDLARRKRRYTLMMATRGVCVILAAVLYPLSIVVALLLVVGGALLPWCAVLIANDGPARKRRPVSKPIVLTPLIALPAADDDRTIDG